MKFLIEDSNKIDLHIHTNFSDGRDFPIEIIRQALNLNLNYIAFADHMVDEARFLCGKLKRWKQEFDLKIIPACELCVKYKNKRIHLLAYNYNPLFRQMVLPAINKKFSKDEEMTLKKACNLIHVFGGKAVLAHPFKYNCNAQELVEDILKEKCIDGIECIHAYHTQEEIDYLLDICEKNALYVTAGSDYHYQGRNIRGVGKQNIIGELPGSYSTIEQQLMRAKEKYITTNKR